MTVKGPWIVYLLAALWLVAGMLALSACQANDNRLNSIMLLPTPDPTDLTTAFIVQGLAVHRYADLQAGVVCWVFRDSFYQVTAMSCLPEAQVTPAPAVIWSQR